ncbi:MAG: polysaccharide deacetylase family protein [Halodesulfurarchaeum sp.]
MTDPPRAVLSVDFELFEHTPAYRNAAGETTSDGVGLDGGRFLRTAFDEHDAATTWFVVSAVAEEFPDAVAALATGEHEIASHTRTHRLLTDLDPDERDGELADSRRTLESATGERVSGFRAPAFDLPADHFEALAAAGYEYDSSVIASRAIPGWYGGEYDRQRPAPARAVRGDAPEGVCVLPASVMPGLRLPLTGTWLRFFGPRYTILGMRWLARRGLTPVLYVHPWELVELPDVAGVPERVYWHTGAWMRRAVSRILSTGFQFVTAREALAAADSTNVTHE